MISAHSSTRQVINNPDVNVTVEYANEPTKISTTDTRGFQAIVKATSVRGP
jgi:hypothetical protein